MTESTDLGLTWRERLWRWRADRRERRRKAQNRVQGPGYQATLPEKSAGARAMTDLPPGGPYVSAYTIARTEGVSRRAVIEFVMKHKVPIYAGEVEWSAFVAAREKDPAGLPRTRGN